MSIFYQYQNSTGNICLRPRFPPLGFCDIDGTKPVIHLAVSAQFAIPYTTECSGNIANGGTVLTNPETLITLPNAIAPGANFNDQLKIIKPGIASLNYFRIFNRRGVQVFSIAHIDDGW